VPKRLSKGRRPRDVNQLAYRLVRKSSEQLSVVAENHQGEISRIMSGMGRKGGKIGGKRKLETLTPGRRREIAFKAAQARWKSPSQSNT
jgi:hypothetical protein